MLTEIKFCRICLSLAHKNTFIDIFGSNDQNISQKILLIANIQIGKNENEIYLLCQECLNKLNQAVTFREKCQKAFKYFKTIKQVPRSTPNISNEDQKNLEINKNRLGKNEGHQCLKCDKFFSSPYYLKNHEYIKHTEIDQKDLFQCDNCDYTAKTKNLIRAHLVHNHINSRPDVAKTYQCRFCGKICLSIGALYSHEKIHKMIPKEEYLKCNYCNKSFKEKRLLKSHIQLVHEKSRMKQCNECGLVVTCSGSLNKHRKAVHLNIRNHICSECDQKFATNQQLLKHISTHTRDRPFPCLHDLCPKMFVTFSGRKKHMKKCTFSSGVIGEVKAGRRPGRRGLKVAK